MKRIAFQGEHFLRCSRGMAPATGSGFCAYVVKITNPNSHNRKYFFISVRVEAHLLGECDIIVAKWKIICEDLWMSHTLVRLSHNVWCCLTRKRSRSRGDVAPTSEQTRQSVELRKARGQTRGVQHQKKIPGAARKSKCPLAPYSTKNQRVNVCNMPEDTLQKS